MAQRIYANRIAVGKTVDEDVQVDGDPKFDDSNNPKIDAAARQAGAELEQAFKFFLAGGAVPIPDANVTDWFVQLNDMYAEILFWYKSNGNENDKKNFWEVTVPNYKEQYVLPFKSTTYG